MRKFNVCFIVYIPGNMKFTVEMGLYRLCLFFSVVYKLYVVLSKEKTTWLEVMKWTVHLQLIF